MIRSTLVLFGALVLAGCGGIADKTSGTTNSGSSSGSGSGGGSGGSSGGGSGSSSGSSSGGTTTGIPKNHRPSGSTCSGQRGAGQVCTFGPGDAAANACAVDSDCTAGKNGRCISPTGPAPVCAPASCSYDQCQSDAECPSREPCECRGGPDSSEPNVCMTGGNCAVDADCGAGGYCSPGAFAGFCTQPIYFCHSAHDTCVNDSDCPPSASTTVLQGCNYDAALGHFACSNVCIPPP